jgi:hypothetical protein
MYPVKKRFDVLRLEQLLNRELNPEEQTAVALWEKGRALAQVVPTYAWDVILEMLQSYPLKAMDALMRLSPGEEVEVRASHAVAYALNQFYEKFQEDVANAIEASRHTPDVVKEQLQRPTTAPPEL